MSVVFCVLQVGEMLEVGVGVGERTFKKVFKICKHVLFCDGIFLRVGFDRGERRV